LHYCRINIHHYLDLFFLHLHIARSTTRYNQSVKQIKHELDLVQNRILRSNTQTTVSKLSLMKEGPKYIYQLASLECTHSTLQLPRAGRIPGQPHARTSAICPGQQPHGERQQYARPRRCTTIFRGGLASGVLVSSSRPGRRPCGIPASSISPWRSTVQLMES
jgi:hypothetical protein